MADIIKALEAKTNDKIPALASGDVVSVHVKIKEGDRERIQEFKGMIIRLRKGGNDASMTVRRMASNGVGVEGGGGTPQPGPSRATLLHARAHG